jgi:hypothetical protein
VDDAFARREARYLRFKELNPDVPFSHYLMERQLRTLSAGSGALKVAFASNEEFWASGEARAKRLLAGVEPRHNVVEYGCGSLRIAAHFIRHLDPGRFFGLDVVAGFYEAGMIAIGTALAAEKVPRLEVIGEDSLAAAQALGADLVYSNVVCSHVHPDEIENYFHNLARLAQRPGARLIFNAELCEHPHRYAFDGWAWPLEFYKQSLSALTLARATTSSPRIRGGETVVPVDFEFHR